MAETRKTLALTLNITDNWIGGTYYIMNLIRALNTLPGDQKPRIVILSPEPHALEYTRKETGYPFLHFIRTIYSYTHIKGAINRLLKKKIFIKEIGEPVDVLFPAVDTLHVTRAGKKVYWIPDFQEHYFSSFFSEEELTKRRQQQEFIARQDHLVLSSRDAKKDFEKFYPQHTCRVHVMPFAVSNPDISGIDATAVLSKYNIGPGYFFIANQFWVHKNHVVVLEAIHKLKKEGYNFQFVFSGKTNDYRSAGHFEMLTQKVNEWGIGEQVRFLGFIDRVDQLVLMKNAVSIIQPSLFEGWGTVVEDAKSMQQHIIASDIDVHKEQLAAYPHLLFEKSNSNDLAEKIKEMKALYGSPVDYDYRGDIRAFADNAMKVLFGNN